MKELYLTVDPFIMQLLIVPLVVIGLGVGVAAITRKFYLGPVVTFLLTFLNNFSYFKIFYPGHDVSLRTLLSWCLIYPVTSLLVSGLVVAMLKKMSAGVDGR